MPGANIIFGSHIIHYKTRVWIEIEEVVQYGDNDWSVNWLTNSKFKHNQII